MTTPTGVTTRFAIANSVREDLEDIIYNISPMDTYFMSNVERTTANSTLHEWQTDTLAAANTANAAIEGDDMSAAAESDTNRYKNYTQILRKEVVISGTLDAVRHAGKSTETAYRIMKKGKELKRDLEIVALGNGPGGIGATAGAAASARAMAGVSNWIFGANHIKAATQTATGAGNTTTAPASGIASNTPVGTATAFVEADLQTALAVAWTAGGDTDVILCGSAQKRKIDGFTGIATRFRDVGAGQQAQIIGAADVYVSDYGSHKIVLSRYTTGDVVYCLDMQTWALAYLRPFQTIPIAKTGDSEKNLLLTEVTLVAKAPTGNTKLVNVT